MTKVKICGITNLEDALLSAKFGADALGFNFYEKSPRYISPENAREIIEQLPPKILKVGVFVNESLDKIIEIAQAAKLNALQLHGEETSEFVRDLKLKTNLEIIKAFRVSPEFKPEDVLQYETDAILLDAYSRHEHGGTGETFDWEIAKQVQKIFPEMYLAGGLSVNNIIKAIKTVKPFGIDACSCLEQEKGKKNKSLVRDFIIKTRHTKTKIKLMVSKTLSEVVEKIGDLEYLSSQAIGDFEFQSAKENLFTLNESIDLNFKETLKFFASYDSSSENMSITVFHNQQQIFQGACHWNKVNPYFSVFVQDEGLVNLFFEK